MYDPISTQIGLGRGKELSVDRFDVKPGPQRAHEHLAKSTARSRGLATGTATRLGVELS